MKEEPVRGRLGCYKQYGAELPKEVEITATPSTGGIGDRDLIVADPAMIGIFDLLARLGRSDLAVLIYGETGVGKEHAAFAVHHHSTRRAGPFVAINCAALQDSLVESELFGHERGAFSGAVAAKPGLLETARGGTVFLDEVGELPVAIQAKLLRVIESRRVLRVGGVRDIEFDFRVVAATNRDLDAEVATGRFRRDLLYRLAAATVEIPPLRERPCEIELLARAFLDEGCRRTRRAPLTLTEGAVTQLATHDWPGNVRELRNAMLLAAATATGDVVDVVELRPNRANARAASIDRADAVAWAHAALAGPAFRPTSATPPDASTLTLAEEITQLEARRMAEALTVCEGVHNRAAARIGMPLRTFSTKVKLYGLSAPLHRRTRSDGLRSRTRRRTAHRWSSWSARGARRRSWRRSSESPLLRFGAGYGRRTVTAYTSRWHNDRRAR